MARRFAGTRAPIAGIESRSGSPREFRGIDIGSSRVGSNAGAAADAVSLGRTFGSIRKNSPDYPGISTTGNEITGLTDPPSRQQSTSLALVPAKRGH